MHIELHYILSQDGEFIAAESVLNKIWDKAIRIENHKCLYQMPIEQFFCIILCIWEDIYCMGDVAFGRLLILWILERKAIYDKYEIEIILSTV